MSLDDVNPSLVVLIVVLGVGILVGSVARLTAKILHARYAPLRAHTCEEHVCLVPEPVVEIQIVERNHNPWTPVPWKVVK